MSPTASTMAEGGAGAELEMGTMKLGICFAAWVGLFALGMLTHQIIRHFSCTLSEFQHKIHSVPGLYLEDTKEIIYGKEVFDYLLLPNRGKLLVNNNTKERDPNILKENEKFEGEPLGFTIGNVTSQSFENINEEKDNKDDINFSWMSLDKNVLSENTGIIDKVANSDENDKKIPSIESILAEREKALKV